MNNTYQDFGVFLKAPFSDVAGLKNLLMGSILSIIPVVNVWCFAYMGEAMLAGMRGDLATPCWSDWGKRFILGLKTLVAVFIYLYFPLLMLVLAFVLPGPFGLIALVSGILLGVFIPYAVANMINRQRFGSIFDFFIIFRLLKQTFRVFIPAYLLTAAVLCVSLFLLLSQPFLGFAGFLFSFYFLTVFSMATGRWYYAAMTQS